MRHLALAAVLILSADLAAAPVPKELKRRPDAERLQGVWIIPPSLRWYFKGDKLYSGGLNTTDNLGTEYGIVLRPELAPTQMDITQNGRIICTGIYKFDGEALHITYVHSGERPADFAPAPGRSIHVLIRSPEAK